MKCNDQSTLKMAVVSVDGCTYERNAHFCHYADIFIIIIYILLWFDDIWQSLSHSIPNAFFLCKMFFLFFKLKDSLIVFNLLCKIEYIMFQLWFFYCWNQKASNPIIIFVCLPVCLSACLFVCLSVCLSVCLFLSLFVCLSVCLSVCFSVCLSVCLFVSLSVYLSVCPSVCLTDWLTDWQMNK